MPDGSTRPSCSSGASASDAVGGIAAGRGDVAGRADLGAVQLGQAEREPVEQVRCGVRLAVPLFVVGARKPEVGAEVDEVADGVDERSARSPATGRAAGRGRPHRGRRGRRPAAARTRATGRPRRATGTAPTRRAHVRVGGDLHHLDVGVAGEQAQQLCARVPRSPDDCSPIRHAEYYTGDCIPMPARCRTVSAAPPVTPAAQSRRSLRVPNTSSTIPPTNSFTATIHSVTSRAVCEVSVTMLVGSFRS